MKKKNYFGLKEIKEKSIESKEYFPKKNKNKLTKQCNTVYDEKRAKFLFIKYKKFGKESAKNDLITLCYPVIFAVLRKTGKKINTSNMLLNNDDLFSEGVLIVDRCIKSYSLKYKVKFSTFLWISLTRGFIRFIHNHMLKPNKIFTSIMEGDNGEEGDLEVLDAVNNKKKYTRDVASYLKSDELESVENDFLETLTDLETKVIYLKYKKYSNEEISKILEINITKYYKILKKIKVKTRREL